MPVQWYYALADGSNSEPMTAAELRNLVARGAIGPETPVSKGGAWFRAKQVKGLFPDQASPLPQPNRPRPRPLLSGDYPILDAPTSPAPRFGPPAPPDKQEGSEEHVRPRTKLGRLLTPTAGPGRAEPWYYRFLGFASWVIVILGIGQFLIYAFIVLIAVVAALGAPSEGPGGGLLVTLLLFVPFITSIGILLGSLFIASLILLARDAARSLRMSRPADQA